MTFIVATNVVASWPPERRPTGTPHARAKMKVKALECYATNLLHSSKPTDAAISTASKND